MLVYFLCFLIFMFGYIINLTYISVFYHRSFAHQAVILRPWLRKFVINTGIWVTGLDPKAWSTMHRLHHKYSDTPRDPHSPVNDGIFGLALAQLRSYKNVLIKLIRKEPKVALISRDLDFDVSWVNKKGAWLLPYMLQATLGFLIGALTGIPLVGLAYFLGIMSHPIQGWMVNSMGHALGYQNFKNGDNSRNNTFVALTVAGEGYQNNHHRFPESPKFSVKWWEIDFGYGMCLFLQGLGCLEINESELFAMQAEARLLDHAREAKESSI